ncbi:MAG: hypothetical protein ABJC66_12085 [Gammaproteobacteria bacterium]
MNGDLRGWRIALVPDVLINPPPQPLRNALSDALGTLEAGGYGVLQLPPGGEHGLLLAVIADQVAEYAHHGYAVVAIGVLGEPGNGLHWRSLAPLLRHRGAALPPRHIIRPDADAASEGHRLAAFLTGYDLPEEQQRRWRE